MDLQSPISIFLAWIAFPCLVLVLSAGVGLLIEKAAAIDHGAMTLPTGFASVTVLYTLVLQVGLPADWCSIAIAAFAVTGFVFYFKGSERIADSNRLLAIGALGAFAIAYLIGIAPLIGSGRIGVLGYYLLNDPAWHLALINWIHEFGASAAAANDSSYAAVSLQLDQGYPLGSYAWPLTGMTFTGLDSFFIWTPTAAVTLGMIAIVAFCVASASGASRRWAMIAGALIGVGYLPLSYLAQGGVKEVGFAFAFMFAAYAIAAVKLTADDSLLLAWRRTLVAAFGVASMIAVFGPGAGVWIGPLVLAAVVFAFLVRPGRTGRARIAVVTVLWGITVLLLSLPAIISTLKVFSTVSTVAESGQIGNLLGAVPIREVFNTWISPDYRFADPQIELKGWVLAVTSASGMLALVGGVRELFSKRLFVPLAGFSGLVAILYLERKYNIYFVAKSYVAFAPIAGCATLSGLIWLIRGDRLQRVAGIAFAVAFGVTIAVSLAVIYGSVFLSPNGRFEELASINERIEGKGPTLVNEREEYARIWLKDAKPWESYGMFVPDRGFRQDAGFGVPIAPDVDGYTNMHIGRFPLIVDRKNPGSSRPPSNYEFWFETERYEVWRRTGQPPSVHVPVGLGKPTGSARLQCNSAEVSAAIDSAEKSGGKLIVAVPSQEVVIIPSLDFGDPPDWSPATAPGPRSRSRDGVGEFVAELNPDTEYQVFIQGSFGMGVEVLAGPQSLGSVRQDLGQADQWEPLESFRAEGPTKIRIQPARNSRLIAGNLRYDNIVAMAFVADRGETDVIGVEPGEVNRFCGEQVDWLEVVE